MAPTMAPQIVTGTATIYPTPAIPADVSVANQLPAATDPKELCTPAAMLPAATPDDPKPIADKNAGKPR